MLDEINAAALAWQDADTTDWRTAHHETPEATPSHRPPADNDLELPGWMWKVMFAAYGVFFAGLLFGTGHDGEALFALVVSGLYLLVYFVTAGVLVGLNRPGRSAPFARGQGQLETGTGPMSTKAVAGQVLVIPVCIALFGVGIAIIRAILV
jgi:hypothetical protein